MANDLENLIRRAADGDEEAFRTLHDDFQAFVTAHVSNVLGPDRRDAVCDVVQDVWRDAHQSLSRYDPSIASFTRWLAVISVRRALNYQRRERAEDDAIRRYDALRRQAVTDADGGSLSRIERGELLQAVRDCAAILQGREREVFAAIRLAALSVVAVAASLSISAGRVRGALSDANQKVLECLRGKGLP
ncbi:MAG TPA: sigma-70 family RNA polymerase sigma factor [Phycisphaerae bacterium]|mgnify:CR=1 FL=1|nr:sigma-70 family RNA polymerase sigma factor [Phycisphaerae bacterium]HRW54877.1 sigma-70 family RNA polymerase sigma factor [Phycisphaerae bacterium]